MEHTERGGLISMSTAHAAGWCWYIAAEHPHSETVQYWSGSGLTTDVSRAKLFDNRADAFAEWNDHCATFANWKAEMYQRRA
jgi:hypothetical protein